MTYLGGKGGDGVFQKIISQMPPHKVYIEPFLGGGAIMRLKRPASLNIGVELDGRVLTVTRAAIAGIIGRARAPYARNGDVRSLFLQRDGIAFLRKYKFTGSELVYCDPPYMHECRMGPERDHYRFEMTDQQHKELLSVLIDLPCPVMISGYCTSLYMARLEKWRRITFPAVTRGGTVRTEFLWMNFPEPLQLHDYSYLGENFRERERIKKKRLRWTSRLQRMPALERMCLLSAISSLESPREPSA